MTLNDKAKHGIGALAFLAVGAVLGVVVQTVRESPVVEATLSVQVAQLRSDVKELEAGQKDLAPTSVQIEALADRIDDLSGAVLELSKETRNLAVKLGQLEGKIERGSG